MKSISKKLVISTIGHWIDRMQRLVGPMKPCHIHIDEITESWRDCVELILKTITQGVSDGVLSYDDKNFVLMISVTLLDADVDDEIGSLTTWADVEKEMEREGYTPPAIYLVNRESMNAHQCTSQLCSDEVRPEWMPTDWIIVYSQGEARHINVEHHSGFALNS